MSQRETTTPTIELATYSKKKDKNKQTASEQLLPFLLRGFYDGAHLPTYKQVNPQHYFAGAPGFSPARDNYNWFKEIQTSQSIFSPKSEWELV